MYSYFFPSEQEEKRRPILAFKEVIVSIFHQ